VIAISPQGRHLGTIPVRCPPADCQNVAFSGPEKRALYIAGAGALYKVDMVARGFTGRAKYRTLNTARTTDSANDVFNR